MSTIVTYILEHTIRREFRKHNIFGVNDEILAVNRIIGTLVKVASDNLLGNQYQENIEDKIIHWLLRVNILRYDPEYRNFVFTHDIIRDYCLASSAFIWLGRGMRGMLARNLDYMEMSDDNFMKAVFTQGGIWVRQFLWEMLMRVEQSTEVDTYD
jgi:hypothetical protein